MSDVCNSSRDTPVAGGQPKKLEHKQIRSAEGKRTKDLGAPKRPAGGAFGVWRGENFEMIGNLTLSKCMSIGAHCITHCKMLVEKEKPATLYQPSPHILFEPEDNTFTRFLAYWRMQAGCCPRCAREVLPLVAGTKRHIYI
jgi:hypothetical protein